MCLNEAAARRKESVGLPGFAGLSYEVWHVSAYSSKHFGGKRKPDQIQSAGFLEGFKGIFLVSTLADTASFNRGMQLTWSEAERGLQFQSTPAAASLQVSYIPFFVSLHVLSSDKTLYPTSLQPVQPRTGKGR